MATARRFEDLETWQKARLLCNTIFQLISSPPFSKDYKLKDQINGSSGSIMDNIAEGFGRGSRLEFVNFLSIAKASSAEVQSQLYRALDRKYITKEVFETTYGTVDEICKMINRFMDYLNKSETAGIKFKGRVKT